MANIDMIVGVLAVVIGLCVLAWFDRPSYYSRVRGYLHRRFEYNYIKWKNIPGVALMHKFPRFFITVWYIDINLVASMLIFCGITMIG